MNWSTYTPVDTTHLLVPEYDRNTHTPVHNGPKFRKSWVKDLGETRCQNQEDLHQHHQHPPASDEGREETFVPYRSFMSSGPRELIGIDGMASSEEAQAPPATTGVVKMEEQKIKREPFEASLPPHFRNPEMQGNTFFVLFDLDGFGPNRPYDVSLVVAWLEHPLVFEPNSIESFLGRIIVRLYFPNRGLQRAISMIG